MRIRQQRRRGWLPAVASMSGSATCQAQPVGTWYELISATTSAIYVNRMGGFWGAAGSTFELGIGLAGAEVSIGSLTYESLIEPFVHLPVPIRIPAGTRVAGRSTGNFQGLVIGYLNESVVGSQRPYILPQAAVITTTTRVRLQTTAWYQLTAATSSAGYLIHVNYGTQVYAPGTFEIGIGAAASEVAILTLEDPYNPAGYMGWATPVIPPIRIPSGTRIAARHADAASDYSYASVTIVNESAVVW